MKPAVWMMVGATPFLSIRPPIPKPPPPAETPAPAAAPEVALPTPAMSRILVKKEPGFEGVFIREEADLDALMRKLRPRGLGPRPVFADRFEQPWVSGGGLRLRVSYLAPIGVTWADDSGFHGQIGQGEIIHAPGKVGPEYRRSFPLYLADDTVEYEVEIENVGMMPLTGLSLTSQQERFQPAGGAGPALGRADIQALPDLPLGGRAVVKLRFRLSPGGGAKLNFEQTHLTVTEQRLSGARLLLDAPQAGIADPPGDR